jgi:hypothetical protein
VLMNIHSVLVQLVAYLWCAYLLRQLLLLSE